MTPPPIPNQPTNQPAKHTITAAPLYSALITCQDHTERPKCKSEPLITTKTCTRKILL